MKKLRAASRNEDVSKLSNLPEDVLNKILCSLSQKESVQTCVLSKSWRHRGIKSLTKLELSLSSDFKGNKKSLSSALQRYKDQNLCLNQLCLKIFSNVDEYRFDLPSIEFLQELHLEACRLNSFVPKTASFPLLRKVFLRWVCISNEAAEALLSGCPSIDHFELVACNELTYVDGKKPGCNLKHFSFGQDTKGFERNAIGFEIDSPTIETIRINNSKKWHFHDKRFPRLKSVYLENVELSVESFDFFAPDYMPSLEELQLHRCFGFKEFQLSSASMKHLSIQLPLQEFIKASVDAPNVVRFELVAEDSVPSLSFSPMISSEWKSHVNMSCDVSEWIVALYDLLKAVSESEITLEHYFDSTSWSEDSTTAAYNGFYKPLVDLEHLVLGVPDSDYTVAVFFNSLFRVCRPRYIYGADNEGCIELLWEVLENEMQREESFWNKDLVERSVETYRVNANECRPFHGSSLSQCASSNKNKNRIQLKWKGN